MITIISCGLNHGPAPDNADLYFDCRKLFDPSPIVQDLPGTSPEVIALVLGEHPAVEESVALLARAAARIDELNGACSIVTTCNAGHHRSVAIAETVARYLRDGYGYGAFDIDVLHRELRGTP